MDNALAIWPEDADGDVFRSLQQQEFDFSRPHKIDFNVDLPNMRFKGAVLRLLRRHYPGANIVDHTDDTPPYIQLQLVSPLDYDFIIRTQSELSAEMEKYGGWCDSWGVLH